MRLHAFGELLTKNWRNFWDCCDQNCINSTWITFANNISGKKIHFYFHSVTQSAHVHSIGARFSVPILFFIYDNCYYYHFIKIYMRPKILRFSLDVTQKAKLFVWFVGARRMGEGVRHVCVGITQQRQQSIERIGEWDSECRSVLWPLNILAVNF